MHVIAGRKNPCLTFQSLLQTLCTGCQFVAVVVLAGVLSCGGWQGQVKVNHGQIIHSNLGGQGGEIDAVHTGNGRSQHKTTCQLPVLSVVNLGQ